ncbi:putative transcriptional regulator [Roseimicrobium gellanilyticum]|uniref:Putative transcriptional regulator n=1 Tax=Roseimicrobium gellanilyticum TaxID=748857 RepID=A0A366HEC5_9BACT|nr:BlaI/MecI/CopY family transcriptional regulator [Roseimicrobium gellanilyticum]RBP40410.1 putative transcriptional regulator [Roseimicrobium gellanilyticum]
MPRPPKVRNPSRPEPTEAELPLLRVLWNLGSASVRQVWEDLGAKGSYTTVLKQFQVMHEKGLVTRDESERTHLYQAAMPEERVQRSLLGRLLQQAFEGSAAQLVLGALSTKKVSAEERAEIRKLLDNLDAEEDAKPASKTKKS